MHVQNVRDFPQTKLDSEMNSPFLLNEHGDPRFFFQVFAEEQSNKKTYLKKKKSLIVEYNVFWRIVPYWIYFDQGQDFKLTTELSDKVQYCCNQATKNSLNEATLLMSINEALLSR